eukprot:366460-Chlamydomonas_euryale.AAC.10
MVHASPGIELAPDGAGHPRLSERLGAAAAAGHAGALPRPCPLLGTHHQQHLRPDHHHHRHPHPTAAACVATAQKGSAAVMRCCQAQ